MPEPPEVESARAAVERSVAGHEQLRRLVGTLLPGEDLSGAEVSAGEFHDVVLLPRRAVVKVARGRAAEHLPRRTALLSALADLDLPFAVPRPLGDVLVVDGGGVRDVAAVALSWAPGTPTPSGSGDPDRLRELLEVLAGVDVSAGSAVGRHLDEPHAYAGREDWATLMRHVVDQLPDDVRDEGSARWEAAMALPAVPATLVHGDLAGDNVRWHPDGSLAAVIDWDLASAFDPAVDAACLAWFGWDTVTAAVGPDVLARARVWEWTFHLESVAAAIDNGEGEAVVRGRLAAAVAHLREGRSGPPGAPAPQPSAPVGERSHSVAETRNAGGAGPACLRSPHRRCAGPTPRRRGAP